MQLYANRTENKKNKTQRIPPHTGTQGKAPEPHHRGDPDAPCPGRIRPG